MNEAQDITLAINRLAAAIELLAHAYMAGIERDPDDEPRDGQSLSDVGG